MKKIYEMTASEQADHLRSIVLTDEEIVIAKALTAGDDVALKKRLDGLRAMKQADQSAAELIAIGKK